MASFTTVARFTTDNVVTSGFVAILLLFQGLLTVGCFTGKPNFVVAGCAVVICFAAIFFLFMFFGLARYDYRSWPLLIVPLCLVIVDAITLSNQVMHKKDFKDRKVSWGAGHCTLFLISILYFIYTLDGILNIGNPARVGPWPHPDVETYNVSDL